MAITLSGSGGLFTRLGKIGKVLRAVNTYQDSSLATPGAEIIAQYDAERDLQATVQPALTAGQNSAAGIASQLQSLARSTLGRMVYNDTGQSQTDYKACLEELIAQMVSSGDDVEACTVTASAAADAGNTGNGVLVVTTTRYDGREQENLFQETASVVCVSDSQTGGATAGRESFRFTGDEAISSAFSWEWPGGSGASNSLLCVDATQDNASGNLLTNSDFEDFTANVPDNWAVLSGTAGTDFQKSTASFYDGLASLQFIGGTGATPSLAQVFDDSTTGTGGNVLPLAVYVWNLFVRCDVLPAAGTLTIDLVDGTNTTIQDDQGVNQTTSITLSGVTTSYVAHGGSFRLPKAAPSTVKLRVRLSVALSAGSNCFVDHLALATGTLLYPGGPYASMFSGATAFIAGDHFTLTTTNDRASATYNSTFQTLFDRLFGMRQYDLLLPSSGAPSIADTLITS